MSGRLNRLGKIAVGFLLAGTVIGFEKGIIPYAVNCARNSSEYQKYRAHQERVANPSGIANYIIPENLIYTKDYISPEIYKATRDTTKKYCPRDISEEDYDAVRRILTGNSKTIIRFPIYHLTKQTVLDSMKFLDDAHKASKPNSMEKNKARLWYEK